MLDRAKKMAVSGDVAVYLAVYEAVNGAVYWAVYRAVEGAVYPILVREVRRAG